jgi:hypothetical protein
MYFVSDDDDDDKERIDVTYVVGNAAYKAGSGKSICVRREKKKNVQKLEEATSREDGTLIVRQWMGKEGRKKDCSHHCLFFLLNTMQHTTFHIADTTTTTNNNSGNFVSSPPA